MTSKGRIDAHSTISGGIPVGILTGVYLSEYSSRSFMAAPARFVADVLTGVPSIVVGILGYELLVVPLGGYNGWAGALALAFIMIPLVARTTEEMLLLVPCNDACVYTLRRMTCPS